MLPHLPISYANSTSLKLFVPTTNHQAILVVSPLSSCLSLHFPKTSPKALLPLYICYLKKSVVFVFVFPTKPTAQALAILTMITSKQCPHVTIMTPLFTLCIYKLLNYTSFKISTYCLQLFSFSFTSSNTSHFFSLGIFSVPWLCPAPYLDLQEFFLE